MTAELSLQTDLQSHLMHVAINLPVCFQTYRHFMYHVVEVRIIALTDVWLEVSLGKTESPLNPSSCTAGFFEEI